jgi:hypothetical protein
MKRIRLEPKYITLTFNREWLYVIPLTLIIIVLLVLLNAMKEPKFETFNGYMMNFQGNLIKVEEIQAEEPIVEVKPTLDEYVALKFGHDAWKAFAILHGTKWCGGENGKHNPEALNDNPGSVDRGYWQFNDKFHPEVTNECAKDVVCSTDRAYEMFVHDKGFKQWTAGKCIGV